MQFKLAIVLAKTELSQGSIRGRYIHCASFEPDLTSTEFICGHVVLGGRPWEAFFTAIVLKLGYFFRHVLLILDQNVLMLDVQLAKFEVKHFHNLFKITVASLDHFLSLRKPQLNNMILIRVKVKCHNEKLVTMH